jgi:hypothetical protein
MHGGILIVATFDYWFAVIIIVITKNLLLKDKPSDYEGNDDVTRFTCLSKDTMLPTLRLCELDCLQLRCKAWIDDHV